MQGGPLVHIIAAKAVCFLEAMQPEFKEYARQVVANAKVLAETLAAEGYRIISGGTDTHVMLVDVFAKGMLGSEAEKALGEAAITVNKNAIPFDTNPPMKPSGIRIGTPGPDHARHERSRKCARWGAGFPRRCTIARKPMSCRKIRTAGAGTGGGLSRCTPSAGPRRRRRFGPSSWHIPLQAWVFANPAKSLYPPRPSCG